MSQPSTKTGWTLVTIVVAIAYLVVNLVVDVSYALLDPRIRLS